jgi:hypothetical protein
MQELPKWKALLQDNPMFTPQVLRYHRNWMKEANAQGEVSIARSTFLIEVVQGLENWREFDLAEEVEARLLGHMKNGIVVGIDVDRDEKEK